ncbi:hypothetical protein QM467_13815 [Rhodoblastus sp. 17X3]|uniref:hypothetical protein n=1 Tax=Rhodoblastus sp. 17X3 TaxID=3047026 RepID=UPI0024B863F4|nr:hypothetical protein [Rhodoblastus sp. 17X3]MDI9849133.1 hypothetical protein [Rhodoblastus sp. 17X3]
MNPILARYNTGLPFSVQERDIDLILIEQLHMCRSFADWLTGRLDLTGAVVETARHSVHREHGETDVLVIVRLGEESVAVMIEDKIGAPMQPNQCERYHLRGSILCEEGAVDRYKTVLCAPAGYLAGVPTDQRWHDRVSLEELGQSIEGAAYPGWEWRHAILVAAASRQTRAREADNRANHAYDAVIAPLKRAYHDFVQARYPQLQASRQEGRDREYYLGALGLPPGIRFKHAFFRGEVSAIFEKAWAPTAERHVEGKLPEEAWPVQHGSEFHVRMPVEVMDPQLPFEEQEEVAAKALDQIGNMVNMALSVAKARP